MDADGRLWIAMWDGWCVTCWDPSSGELLGKISLPCAQVTSVAFGGSNLDKLYITTASCGISDDDLRTKQPQAGKLFVADFSESNIRGCKAAVFGIGLNEDKSKI